MKNFNAFQKDLIELGNQELSENIKLLLYKTDPNIFDKIDFNNDLIYKDPLLFAFFNSNKQNINLLQNLLYGYFENREEFNEITVISDDFGRIYFPNLGWVLTKKAKSIFTLNFINDKIVVINEKEEIDFIFESIEYISNTKIELLKYPISILNQFYYDVNLKEIEVEIKEVTQKFKQELIKAVNIIKENVPEHFSLIELTTSKIVIFNVDTYLRNSFATMSAQGIGFLNAYQDNYNEVFFIDDIRPKLLTPLTST